MDMTPNQMYVRAWLLRFAASRVLLVSFISFFPLASWYMQGQGMATEPWVLAVLLGGVFLPVFAVMGGLLVKSRERMEQATEAMEKMDWSLCLDCEHALVGSESDGRCPECGTGFERERTRRIWKGRFSSRPDQWKMWSRILDVVVLLGFIAGGSVLF